MTAATVRVRTGTSSHAGLAPLLLATMASQALLVVLATTIAAIGTDLGAGVGAVGQARSITAGVAIITSVAIIGRLDSVGVPRVIALGAGMAILASVAVAAAPTLAAFLVAHILVGLAFAGLLSAGFAGVAAFSPDRRAWAMGYVAGANSLAWIVVNPIVGVLTDSFSWRTAQVVPGAIALAALLTARAAASEPARTTVPPIRALLSKVSARRWIGAELIAYGAWTALLTFVAAFFIESLGVREAAVGWLLAGGAAAHFAASTHSARLVNLLGRRRVVAASALMMAAVLPFQLSITASTLAALALFCLIALAAGIRTPASGGLGLAQLPAHPGGMMAARTAATQLGYLLGAVIGGAVIATAGYRTLGFVLAAGMAISAALVLRVEDPG
jgi:predicted MFS family arabinose efflux permease